MAVVLWAILPLMAMLPGTTASALEAHVQENQA